MSDVKHSVCFAAKSSSNLEHISSTSDAARAIVRPPGYPEHAVWKRQAQISSDMV